MRYFIFLSFLFIVPVKAEQLCFDIDDMDIKAIEDQIISVEDWILSAIKNKANNSKEDIMVREFKKYLSEGKPIPQSQIAILNKYFNDPNYKNRKERDVEEQLQP